MSDTITQRGMRRSLTGEVISDSMDKTVVVRVDRTKMNKKYKMRYSVSKKYHVHDPENQYKVGDLVKITDTRPLSKNKRWRVTELLSKSTLSENE